MIVLDTTVLVYAKGSDHPLRDPCRELLTAIATGRLEATTTVEVIQEFVHVRARRRPRADAAELGKAYADLLAPLLPLTSEDLTAGLQLYQASTRVGAFDAVLAAAAMRADAQALVSADAAFGELTRLPHVQPNEESVRRLLG